jgi:hypothetical protein
MNQDRFTELLNLRLDHEITPAEDAELEAELQRSSARRREHQAYCRMQRACAQLFERERELAPASFALEKALQDAERKTAALVQREPRRPLVAAFAGFAAMAACITFVLVRTTAPVASSNGDVAATTDSKPTTTMVAAASSDKTSGVKIVPVATSAVTLTSYTEGEVIHADYHNGSLVPGSHPTETAGTTSDSVREEAAMLAQIQLRAMSPVTVEELNVDIRPIQTARTRVFNSGSSLPLNAEFVSFQFQR